MDAKTNRKCLVLKVILIASLTNTVYAAGQNIVTFNIRYVSGELVQLPFQRQISSECVYTQRPDLLTCMANHPYANVTSVWKTHPKYVSYVSVKCKQQNNVKRVSGFCFCKTAPGVGDTYYPCKLTTLAMGTFSSLSRLQVLDLSDNEISDVSRGSFGGLSSLRYISLNRNTFSSLPFGIFCDTPNLEFVFLRGLKFSDHVFPSHSFRCKGNETHNIKVLDISNGNIGDVPSDSMNYLPSLTSLDLSGNELTQIYKATFKGALSLQHLNLTNNALTYLFPYFCDFVPKLTNLLLRLNKFTTFSFEEVEDCNVTKTLDLSANQIAAVSGNVSVLVSLVNLNISHNELTTLNISLQGLGKLETLDISYNKLVSLFVTQFEGNVNLTTLNISNNKLNDSSNFKTLFAPLENLQYLDLSNNNIRSIPNDSFRMLTNLTTLLLSNNMVDTLSSGSFSTLVSLERLSLSNNNIQTIPTTMFDAMTSLKYLSLSFNKISGIGTQSWSLLLSLSLDNNDITVFPELMDFSVMEFINVSNNRLQMFVPDDKIVDFRRMLDMDLSYNQITKIPPAVLQTSTLLQTLNLEHNEINMILNGTMFENMKNLTSLNLAHNRIHTLQTGLLSTTSLPALRVVNISENPLENVGQFSLTFNESIVSIIDLSRCNITKLEQNVFTNLANLSRVNLSYNKLETFPTFLANDQTKYIFEGNLVICACNMSWLNDPYVEFENHVRIPTKRFDIPYCKVYTQSMLYDYRLVLRRQFLCPETNNCDDNCTCYKTDMAGDITSALCRGLETAPSVMSNTTSAIFLDGNDFKENSSLLPLASYTSMETKELYLNSSSIQYLEPELLAGFGKLEILNLGNNILEILQDGVFANKTFLKFLFLKDNLISFFEKGVFVGLSSLREIDISGNSLVTLFPHTVGELSALSSVKYFFLARNPWVCNCSNKKFKTFVDKVEYKIRDRRILLCSDLDQEIIYVPKSSFNCLLETKSSHGSPATIIGIIIAVLIILILTAAVIYFRRELLALLYSKTGCHIPGKSHYPGMHFDGFVSYEPSDQHCADYLQNVLLPKLRNNGYNVQTTADVIPDIEVTQKAIEDSRCSVFIVNKNFSSNSFYVKLFFCALARNKTDSRHRVILIIHGDIDLLSLEPEVMKRLRKGDYITSRSRLWWERLMYELPVPCGFHGDADGDDVSESDVIVFSALSDRSINQNEYQLM